MLVGEIGEEKLLQEVRRIFAATNADVPVAIGDDAAVTDSPSGRQQVWTADLLVEAIHFRSHWQTPQQLGRKCLAVNLSDLAAMGAAPAAALVSIACSGKRPLEEITDICRGIREVALEHGVAVTGGDLSASTGGMVIAIAAGGTVGAGDAVLRSGAAPGDTIYVTGALGSAAAGLRLLENGTLSKPDDSDSETLRNAFIDPQPRCRAGEALAAAGVSAMTDISDGLSTDLRHICQASGTGAQIRMEDLPCDEALLRTAQENEWDLRELMLGGGEDYELLFTTDDESCGDAIRRYSSESGLRITAIGNVTGADTGITLALPEGGTTSLPAGGFDHFRAEGRGGRHTGMGGRPGDDD